MSLTAMSGILSRDAFIPKRDLGILPLVLVLPFIFYPKVVEGDTQPWLLSAGLLALLTFRTDEFISRRELPLIALATLCVCIYVFRANSSFALVRNAYTYVTFIVLWIVVGREKGEYLSTGVRIVTIVWFAVGLYQFLIVKLGFSFEMGRYMPGRSGVPSLAAEASYYGSLSMVQLMYLLTERNNGKNGIFIACAAASVVLSGSLLSMVLLVFPLRRLGGRARLVAALLIGIFVLVDYHLSSSGLAARLLDVTSMGANIASIMLDASLNMRIGHVYFTLVHNLWAALTFASPVDFMQQYNQFALESGVFMEVGSDYILPALGEMIYGAGFVAVLLMVMILREAVRGARSGMDVLERLAFILACMLNPISISNIFLVMYMRSTERE
jgi:hypothetical protein